MIINIQQEFDKLILSTYNNEGNVSFIDIPIPNSEKYEWVYVNNPNMRGVEKNIASWDNKSVKKIPTKFLSKWRIKEFLYEQPDYIKKLLYENKHTPKMFFCDIEVEIDLKEGFPSPEEAKRPITIISYCYENKAYVLGTKSLTQDQILKLEQKINNYFKEFVDEKIEFKYLEFETEYDMLYTFIYKHLRKMGFVTGWNFVGDGAFDWPYILNRCKMLNIDPGMASIAMATDDKKLTGKDQIPLHKVMVDYMDIYKKWDKKVPVKESNSLDWVAKEVLGVQKIKYEGSLQDLYESDFSEYVYYGIVDSILVQLLHQKLQTAEVLLSLAHITGVEINRAFSPVAMTESVASRVFYDRKKVFPINRAKNDSSKQNYSGGLVFKPQAGLHKSVGAFDFASLYPSIIRQWNISPENYIKNTVDSVDETKYIKTASGAVFDNRSDSVFREMMIKYYGMRKEAKDEMFIIEQEIEYLNKFLEGKKILKDKTVTLTYSNINTNKIDSSMLKEEIERLENLKSYKQNLEQGIKIFINSIYGALANVYFVCHNIKIAEAITTQGQELTLYAKKIFNKYFTEHWHKDTEIHKKMGITGPVKKCNKEAIIGGDTDSVFVGFDEAIKSCNWQGSSKDFILQLNEYRLTDYIKNCFDIYAKKHNCTENVQKLELEKIAQSGIYLAKKKYVLDLIWKDPGINYKSLSKISATGVEIVQSSTPAFVRDKLIVLLKEIFKHNEELNMSDFIKKINKIKSEFMLADINDIAMSSSVGNYEKFILNDKTSLDINKGCPIHVRGAGIYNHKLNNSKWKNKYRLIYSGDKVKYYYCKAKTDAENVFSYLSGNYPYEFASEIDYDKQFQKTIIDTINRFTIIMGMGKIPESLITTKKLF